MSAVVVEKLGRVREVEIPGEKDGMAEFARLMDERVAEGNIVLPEGGVAQMAEEYPFERTVSIRGCDGVLRSRPFPLRDRAQQIGQRG